MPINTSNIDGSMCSKSGNIGPGNICSGNIGNGEHYSADPGEGHGWQIKHRK